MRILTAIFLAVVCAPAVFACPFPAPTIDGSFSEREWADATLWVYNMNTPDGRTVPAEIHVLNDGGRLYLAFRHRYLEVHTTNPSVELDANFNGRRDNGDDGFGGELSPYGVDARDVHFTDTASYLDEARGGTNDVRVAGSVQNGWVVVEMSQSISGADIFDAALRGGESLPMRFNMRVFSDYQTLADTAFPSECGARYVTYKVDTCN